MDILIHKFITISPRKILGKNCSEIHFAGTNLSLPFLSEDENSSLDSKYAMSLKDIKSEIDGIKRSSKIVILKSGEPCLQQMALKSLSGYIKKQGLFVALETYGTKPYVIKNLIESKNVDIIFLKIYFPLQEMWIKKIKKGTLVNDYKDMINDIKKTIDILKKSNISVHVKTMVVPSFLYKKNDISKIARAVRDIRRCILEIAPLDPSKASHTFKNVKAPSDDFMTELKQSLNEEYPTLKIK